MSTNQPYRIFLTKRLVPRNERKTLLAKISERKKRVFVVEGDRGSGKTYFLLDLYHEFISTLQDNYKPFFVGLFPYEMPEFKQKENLWLSSMTEFTLEDIDNLLKRICKSLGIEYIEGLEENRPEYMARSLARMQKKQGRTSVILVDSIYECDEKVRTAIEKYILLPFLAAENTVIILSGRGKRPVWTNPELRDPETIPLDEVSPEFVKNQLEKMESKHVQQAAQIFKWSGGYPLLVTLLGQAEELSIQTLKQAIEILIQDTLPSLVSDLPQDTIFRCIQKLSLLSRPFRIPDVEAYLFPADEQKRVNTDKLVKVLLQSYLLSWGSPKGRNGYLLNESIAHPVRELLNESPDLIEQYKQEWNSSVNDLQSAFPGVDLNDYRQMITVL
jgi:hypothetical protein